MSQKTCLYCDSSAFSPIKPTVCLSCGFVQPADPGSVAVPLDLVADFTQICTWLNNMSRALERGETIDRGLLKLMAEQAELVRVWAKEFLPQPSDREVQR